MARRVATCAQVGLWVTMGWQEAQGNHITMP